MKKQRTIKEGKNWWFLLFLVIALCCGPGSAYALPVQDILNLDSITFWERTDGTSPAAYTYGVSSSQLTTRLIDPLSTSNMDFGWTSAEYFDIFYSDAAGTFSINGEYLTVECVYGAGLPWGGGLNLAEIGLNFNNGTPTEYATSVASFLALGDNAILSSVENAIDGDLLTHTTMGNTIGQSERLRITLGFESSSGPALGLLTMQEVAPVPEPATMLLLGTGLVGLAGFGRKKFIK